LKNNSHNSLLGILATVNAEAPKLDIYDFQGFFKVEATSQYQGSREGLNL
jgi:hypothetical protein